jgi:hypothetical protein
MPQKSLLMLLIGLSVVLIGTLFILCNDPTSSANAPGGLTDDRVSGRHGTHEDIVQATSSEGAGTIPIFNDATRGNPQERIIEPIRGDARIVRGITDSNPLPSPITSISLPQGKESGSAIGAQSQSPHKDQGLLLSRTPFFSTTSPPVSSSSTANPSNPPMESDQATSVNVTLEEPPFYRVDQGQVAKMSPEGQQAYAAIQESYIDFYNDWKNHYPNDPRIWNEQMKKFHFQMLLQLGSREVDRLLR